MTNIQRTSRKKRISKHHSTGRVLKTNYSKNNSIVEEKIAKAEQNESNEIPFDRRFSFNVVEASKYFGIGQTKIREIINDPDCDVGFTVGRKSLVIREKMEEYLRNRRAI